jgi:hypothetical protein
MRLSSDSMFQQLRLPQQAQEERKETGRRTQSLPPPPRPCDDCDESAPVAAMARPDLAPQPPVRAQPGPSPGPALVGGERALGQGPPTKEPPKSAYVSKLMERRAASFEGETGQQERQEHEEQEEQEEGEESTGAWIELDVLNDGSFGHPEAEGPFTSCQSYPSLKAGVCPWPGVRAALRAVCSRQLRAGRCVSILPFGAHQAQHPIRNDSFLYSLGGSPAMSHCPTPPSKLRVSELAISVSAAVAVEGPCSPKPNPDSGPEANSNARILICC